MIQQARCGSSHIAPALESDSADARAAIARIKTELRERNVMVDDQANDFAHTAFRRTPPLIWQPEDRATILARVRRTWIADVLHPSLWNHSVLPLRFAKRPHAVVRPYSLHQQATDDTVLFPLGTTIQQVYDAQGGTLLVLGQPGSGKTTLLLELTQTLLDRAHADAAHPIPVVLNLGTWQEDQSLIRWLVAQLYREYSVPHTIGESWVASGMVLPLLDGLDELPQARQTACVEAINSYRMGHDAAWTTPLIVCCRTHAFEALPRLRLHTALEVQSLTRSDIDRYLHNGGRPLAGVRAVLKDDPTLYELLSTPLMVSVTASAFSGTSAATLRRETDFEKRRHMIFTALVGRQFQPPPEGKGVDVRYSKARTLKWLIWLAQRMRERNVSIYWMEFTQLSWMTTIWMRWIPKCASDLVGALLFGFIGLIIGWSAHGSTGGLLGGIIGALIGGVGSGMGDIEPIDTVQWRTSALMTRTTLLFAVGFGSIIGVSFWLIGSLLLGLLVGVSSVVGIFLGIGLESNRVQNRTYPNEGIHRSRHRTLMFLLAGIIFFGFVGGLQIGWRKGWDSVPIGIIVGGVIGGVISGVAGGLRYGGEAVMKHYVLRFLLWASGTFPWDIEAFLDSCAQRRLVQRVGGGWRFPHNLIRDYFAERDPHDLDPWL